ncbi:MAG: YHS domain-containing protein, partial [Actinobacteria bacterium]|nr:YHS domain-containing protein [Actinomycetota bacterium]
MNHEHHDVQRDARPTATVKDPVCGMDVDPETSTLTAVHGGETFHFCSAG